MFVRPYPDRRRAAHETIWQPVRRNRHPPCGIARILRIVLTRDLLAERALDPVRADQDVTLDPASVRE